MAVVKKPMRGGIYWAEFDPVVGSEQGGRRPALVVQNDRGNMFAQTTIVAPVTSRLTSKPYPFQVWLVDGELPKPSVVKCDQVRAVDKERLHEGRIGLLDEVTMRRVDAALKASLELR